MNILAIDDHELFRKGLGYLLKGIDDDIHYAETSSVSKAIREYSETTPELILLDYFMPDTDGQTALKMIKDAFKSSAIVVISSLDEHALIRKAIDHGAAGFIPKASSQSTLVNALKLILDGGIYLPRVAINALQEKQTNATTIDNPNSSTAILSKLTNRQSEVIKGVVTGKANKLIAYEMGISEGTVKSHLSAAFKHLDVTSRTQAVVLLAKHNATFVSSD